MRNILRPVAWALAISAFLFCAACGALDSLGRAASDSAALQQRADDLQSKIDSFTVVLDTYGPLAEDLGPEVQEALAKVQRESNRVREQLNEALEIVKEAQELHQQALAAATDEETGEVDWTQYGLMILAGGGALYTERRKTVKDAAEAERKQQELIADLRRKVEAAGGRASA